MNRDAVMSIAAEIEAMKPDFTTLSDSIWDFAELKFEERLSAGILAAALEENGFAVRRGPGGDLRFALSRGRSSGRQPRDMADLNRTAYLLIQGRDLPAAIRAFCSR